MPKTVLLADDSVVIQKLVGLSFANEDLRLITTDNGDDALTRALQEKPDLVLADVVMPGKNGYELCQAIKQQPELAHVPVLLLTGTFEAFDEERARQIGSAGHITKPFEAQGLVDRVQELLARTQAPSAPPPAQPPQAQPPQPQPPQAQPPVAEPTMIVESDDAYDFFDDDEGVDLSADEPALDESGTDLGMGNADEAFAFGSDLSLDAPSQAPIGTPQQAPVTTEPQPTAATAGGLEPGGDLTVAMTPDQPTPMAPPPIPEQPAATPGGPAGNFETTAPSEPAPVPTPPQVSPPPQPALDFAPPMAGNATFGSQNAVPPTAPQPAQSQAPPTQIIEGISLDGPPPVPAPGDPGETVVADDLFADVTPPAAPARDEGLRQPGPGTSPAEEDLEFSFDTSVTATQAPPPPVQQMPTAPGPVAAGPAIAPEPAAATDPVIEPLQQNPAGAPIAAPPAQDLLSTPLESEDFTADPDDGNDLLEPLSTEDASEFDISSSDLGDPLAAGGAEPMPQAQPPREVTPPTPQQTGGGSEVATRIFEPETAEPGRERSMEATPTLGGTTPDISPVMRQRIHEMLEKTAWEAFADLSDSVVRQVVQKVEEIAWEVVPHMAESLVREEIRRMKGDPEDPR